MKVHLVDGTYELFRAHYGAPPATDATGREVGATRGLVRSLAALLADPEVTHVAAAFDTVIESFRNALFAGYKTGEGIEPALLAQFALAERAARLLGICVYGMVDFEADDALATAAHRLFAAPEVEQIVICSPDKDLAQCVVGRRVCGFDRLRETLLDEGGVVEKFGVPPRSIPDWLALVGDAADGIPGIPRWGKKGAAVVLARYERLEAIPLDASAWDVSVRGAASLAENLKARRDDALLYRTLATLRTDVPIPCEPADLEWRGPSPEFASFAAELGLGERVVEMLERAAPSKRRARA